MKRRGREEKRVSLTVRKQSLTAFAPASAAKTTLEFLTASARWSQDEFIRAMHNAKGRDYHIASALGPWQRRLIGDIERGPGEALVFPLASGEVSVHSWERWRSERESGGRGWVVQSDGSPRYRQPSHWGRSRLGEACRPHTHRNTHLHSAFQKTQTHNDLFYQILGNIFSCHGTRSPNKIRVNIKQECLYALPL